MVIQRWQSLLLLVAFAVMACFTFFSIGQVQTEDYTYNFTSLGFYQEGETTDGGVTVNYPTWFFFSLSLTTSLLTLIDIFLYKNLPLQKKVCLVCVLFTLASAATAAALGYTAIEGGRIGWSALSICPLIALCGEIMAYGCMRRDHRLLKAVDRIR